MRTAGMPLTIFSVKGHAGVKRERNEAAVIAGFKHVPQEALIAVEPRGIVCALMPSGFERSAGFGPDARLVRSHFYPMVSARSEHADHFRRGNHSAAKNSVLNAIRIELTPDFAHAALTELGDNAVTGDRLLGAHQLSSQESYHYWRTPGESRANQSRANRSWGG